MSGAGKLPLSGASSERVSLPAPHRPAWLEAEPTGALAAVIILRAHLTVAHAYAELGLPVAPSTMDALRAQLRRLVILLQLELGA